MDELAAFAAWRTAEGGIGSAFLFASSDCCAGIQKLDSFSKCVELALLLCYSVVVIQVLDN